jgi:hypothetical protein
MAWLLFGERETFVRVLAGKADAVEVFPHAAAFLLLSLRNILTRRSTILARASCARFERGP